MKVLIWIVCIICSFFVYVVVFQVMIGVRVPRILQILITSGIAGYFCRQWDEVRARKIEVPKDSAIAKLQNESIFREPPSDGIYREGKQDSAKEKTVVEPVVDFDEVPSSVARRFREQQDDMHLLRDEKSKQNTETTIEEIKPVTVSKVENTPIEHVPEDIGSLAASDSFEILKKLKSLNDEGIITDEEYTEKKKEILGRI